MSRTAPAPRNSTAHWQALDREHHLHPFTEHKGLAQSGARIIVKADGTYLWDSEGRRLLDAFAGLWCVNVGYGRKELADVAHKQMLELPYYNTFFKTSTPPAVELTQILAEMTPGNLNYVFYGLSVSDANDTIARMIRQFWNLQGKKTKKTIIARENGYHGSTMVAASISGMNYMHQLADLPLPGFVHIVQPYWYGLGGKLSPAEFGLQAARALEDKIVELGADNVAAFFAEPIQGAGGVIIPPDSYWPEIQRICRKHDVLLVADEVICGFGRTGQTFAAQSFGVTPDMITMAKGITNGAQPMGAVAASERIHDTIMGAAPEGAIEFFHGYTYSGHPAACAAALATLDVYKKDGLFERGRELSPYFLDAVFSLKDIPVVADIRGYGMFAAIDVHPDGAPGRRGQAFQKKLFANGLNLKTTGDCAILAPPLIADRSHVDLIADILRKTLVAL